ncbi:MAG: anaerobic ribonucleoside-triphosphate reductase activating protein [Clostridia bacterium]|nr:anaerobic ribonucleoside-triphosphate reductase activating protein [Clostridia bacterium]
MNYGNIKLYDIANGPGVRVSLFVSGCRNHCHNCFNPETWDFNYGKLFDKEAEDEIIEGMKPDHIKGFTLLGGDPFEPENATSVLPFMENLRFLFPHKSFWAYSGYLYEDILAGKQGEAASKLLLLFDVLVDGRFVEELKDLHLRFRGSSNQRLIDVPQSLSSGTITIWDGTSQP